MGSTIDEQRVSHEIVAQIDARGLTKIGSRNGVRGEKCDDFGRGEARITETAQDAGNGVEGLGNREILSGSRRVLAAEEELQARCARAV